MHVHFIIILSIIHKYYILCSTGIYHNLFLKNTDITFQIKWHQLHGFKKKKLRMVIVNTSLILTRTSDTQGSRAFYIIFIPHNHLQFTD